MRVRVGTSGFAYKEWKGSFYPEKLRDAEMLGYYATRLDAVEINNTFYRMPRPEMLEGWRAKVPEDFRFVLKASRAITHIKRLKDAADPLGYLLRVAASLGTRLGPILFQLPPNLKKDMERLGAFLELLPADCRAALELRHASWRDAEVSAALRRRGVALCVVDREDEEIRPVEPTASWGYLRLRRPGYADTELDRWRDEILAQPWEEAFVFFKHEDAGTGPRLAGRLLRRVHAGK